MYVSKHHALPEPGEAQALIEAHPLGAWVVPRSDGLVAEGTENAAAMAFLVERAVQRLR